MNKDSMEFVVYLIHACADRWHMTPKQVYLIPHYDILHTQGSGYLVDDIQKYLAVRGVSI